MLWGSLLLGIIAQNEIFVMCIFKITLDILLNLEDIWLWISIIDACARDS